MKILLTGANGQVGRELLDQAAGSNTDLVGFARSELDIADSLAVSEALRQTQPELVINAAAYTAVDRAEQEAEQAFAANRDGPGHLAEACSERGIPLFHISTDYVFDGCKDGPYLESDPTNPQSVYGHSKLAGEEAVRQRLDRHLILRTSWVFGHHGHNFVKTVLRLARQGGPLRIVADQQGAPTSTASIASCLLELARRYEQTGQLPWGTYHFSGQPYTTWHGFAEEIIAQASKIGLLNHEVELIPITTAEFPTPAKRPPNSRLDTTQSREILATPPKDWRRDLATVLQSIKTAE